MPFPNRLPISHMMLTLKYISQELISELQFWEWIDHIAYDVDFEKYIARIDLKMPFLNRLPISHMMLTLKYISQEFISELQFWNGLTILHMILILKNISQELTSKCHSGIDCPYLIGC